MKNKIALFTHDDIGAEVTAHLLDEHFELVHINSLDHPELKSDEFILILCDDYGNPKIQFCSEVNTLIPVLFLTEKTEEEIHSVMDKTDREFAFLKKPFYPEQLLNAIHMTLK